MKKLVNANLQSVEEMMKRMIDGERFCFGAYDYFFTRGEGFRVDKFGKGSLVYTIDVSELASIQPNQVFVEVDVPWYENIPEGGVLCWVSDLDPNRRASAALITHFKMNMFSTNTTEWTYATPVKPEECLQK